MVQEQAASPHAWQDVFQAWNGRPGETAVHPFSREVSPGGESKQGDDVKIVPMQPVEEPAVVQHASVRQLDLLKRRKRRLVRLCSLLGLALGTFLVWFLATLPWLYVEFSPKEYSSEHFMLQVRACAVEVREGPGRRVVVKGQTSSLDVTSEPLPLRGLTVRNHKGCLHIPFFQCHKVCSVLVEVPAGSAPERLQIFQEAGDTTPGLTVDVKGVQLQNLLLRSLGGNWWDFAGETLELKLRDATVQGTLGVSLKGGSANIENCVLKGSVRLISQENSVYIVDSPVPSTSQPLRLSWRQVDMRVYIGATTLGYDSPDQHPVAQPDPTGVFASCESSYYAYEFGRVFDKSRDGFVDTDEFVETLRWKTYWDSIGKCCGSNCPFSSWCDGLALQFFSIVDETKDGASLSDRANFLSVSSLWKRVKAKGGLGAMLVPGCHRNLDLMHPTAAALQPSTTASPVFYEDVRSKMQRSSQVMYSAGGVTAASKTKLGFTNGSVLTESWDGNSISYSMTSEAEYVPSHCVKDADCFSRYCRKTSGNIAGTCSFRPTQEYSYMVGSWSACNASCGGGGRTRNVSCVGKDDALHYPLAGHDAPCLPTPVPSMVEVGCAPEACVSPQLPPASSMNCTITPDQDLDEQEVGFILIARGIPLGVSATEHHITSYVLRWGLDGASPLPHFTVIAESAPVASVLGELEIRVPVNTALPPAAVTLLLFARSAHGLEEFATSAPLRDAVPMLEPGRSWMTEAGGEVRLLLRQDNGTDGSPVALPSVAHHVEEAFTACRDAKGSHAQCTRVRARALQEKATIWCPEGKSPTDGLRMLPSHARLLQNEVGTRYGDLLSTDDALIVIDVVPSPGVPGSRWIYATRPVYLSTDPALLFFLSAGMLVPAVKHFRVALTDSACDLNFTNSKLESTTKGHIVRTYADQQQRLERVYEQIFNALHSDGLALATFAADLRGLLVMLSAEHRPYPEKSHIYEFERTGQGWNMKLRESTAADQRLITAIGLSIGVGCVVGLQVMLISVRYLQYLTEMRRREERGRLKMLAMYGEANDTDEALLGDRQGKQLSRIEKFFDHPLTRPLQLISMFIIEPLRRKIVDPLDKFVVERCEFGSAPLQAAPKEEDGAWKETPRGPTGHRSAPKPFVYMREFRRHFEVFCMRENLSSKATTKDIEQVLIMKHECRITGLTVRRMQGVKWSAASEQPVPSTTPIGSGSTPEEVLEAFFESNLVHADDDLFNCFIDLEDRYGPKGNFRLGLIGKLNKFCQLHDCDMLSFQQLSPKNTEGPLRRVCKAQKVPFNEVQVRQIYGLRFVEAAAVHRGVQVTRQWYLVQFCTVVVHLSVLLTPSALMLVYAIVTQSIYAQTTAVSEDVLSLEDVIGRYPARGGLERMNLNAQVVVMYNVVFSIVTLVRVLLYYFELPERGPTKVIPVAYSILLTFHLLIVCIIVGILASWFILAALIDPTRFLPYGAAVIVTVLVVKMTHAELQAAATSLKKALRLVFDKRFAFALRKAKVDLQEERQDRMAQKLVEGAGGSMRRRTPVWEENAAADQSTEEEKQIKPTPGELFSVMDKDENGEVELAEFKNILCKLDIGIAPAQIDQLFSYCDVDSSGSINEKELTEAWEFLIASLMESAAQGSGLGTTDILLTCCLLCAALILLMSFIFLALQGWYNESSFDSMVQTVMVSLGGTAMKKVRSNVDVEGDDEAVNAIVGDLFQQDKDGGGDGESKDQ